jgi:hypothetical protein
MIRYGELSQRYVAQHPEIESLAGMQVRTAMVNAMPAIAMPAFDASIGYRAEDYETDGYDSDGDDRQPDDGALGVMHASHSALSSDGGTATDAAFDTMTTQLTQLGGLSAITALDDGSLADTLAMCYSAGGALAQAHDGASHAADSARRPQRDHCTRRWITRRHARYVLLSGRLH